MKVLLIGNYIYAAQESMQRFATLLLRLLHEAGHEVRLVQPPPLLGQLRPAENGIGKWLGYVDRFVLFRPRLRQAVSWAEVVHICDHSNAIYVPWLKGKPHLVTCHDMMAIRSALCEIPEHKPRWSGCFQQRWVLRGLRQAQRIVCVSEQTRREFLSVSGLPKERVTVVPNALNYTYTPVERAVASSRLVRLGLSVQWPFLLHVGGNQWYKNRPGVLRMFQNLSQVPGFDAYRLVMAGKPWTDEMRHFIRGAGLVDRIHELIDPSDEDLRALYSTTQALVFPSLHEGFGWPIIEAQACGCPVFTTNRPPMSEVGGNAAIYFDPTDEAGAAQIIARELTRREALRRSGFLNVARFTTGALVTGYLEAYRTVCIIPADQNLAAVPSRK